jgi:hypothetical protein
MSSFSTHRACRERRARRDHGEGLHPLGQACPPDAPLFAQCRGRTRKLKGTNHAAPVGATRSPPLLHDRHGHRVDWPQAHTTGVSVARTEIEAPDGNAERPLSRSPRRERITFDDVDLRHRRASGDAGKGLGGIASVTEEQRSETVESRRKPTEAKPFVALAGGLRPGAEEEEPPHSEGSSATRKLLI